MALWSLEDVYQKLLKIDRLLEQAAKAGTDAQRRLLISQARLLGSESRLSIVKVHPTAPTKVSRD